MCAGTWRQVYCLTNVVSVVIAAVLSLVSQLMILFHLTVHIKGAASDLVLSIVEHQRGVILHTVRIVALL